MVTHFSFHPFLVDRFSFSHPSFSEGGSSAGEEDAFPDFSPEGFLGLCSCCSTQAPSGAFFFQIVF